jgi:ABC-type branched-subunit amino acid transport system ATPase component/branched-subunit amino acid ABC-type transport system permease component
VATAVQFAVLGLGTGAVLALLAQGLVVVHRGSGVLNFAHAAMAMAGALVYWEVHEHDGWPFWPSLLVAVVAGALLGAISYLVAIRPLRSASSLSRVVVTLGLLILLQGVCQLIWGVPPRYLTPFLPTDTTTVGSAVVPVDRVLLVGIAAAITLALSAAYRLTPVGLAMRAGAENPLGLAAMGWSPDALAALSWAAGGALAAVAGVLIGPITGITVDQMPLLVIPALAAALCGGFVSVWLTFAGALAIGIAQSEITGYVHQRGVQWALPFAIIVALLAVRGRGLPVRDAVRERLPAVGSGRIRLVTVPVVAACALVVGTTLTPAVASAVSVSLAWATISLSVVVLLGYTGQLSFEQMAMAGLAAVIAGRLVASAGWSFEAAFAAALACAVPIGALFALPALRTRGVELAVLTLGLGMVVYQLVFQNADYTGGVDGTLVGPLKILGIDVDAIGHPGRYAVMSLLVFTACAVVVANVRRGSAGRRLLAVRTNERAAAALGISVFASKLFAFVVGASTAAVGGLLLSFQSPLIDYSGYAPLQSVLVVAYAVIGGIGYLFGPVLAGMFAAGGLGAWLLQDALEVTDPIWLAIVGGAGMILLVVLHPDGAVDAQLRIGRRLAARLPRRGPRVFAPLPDAPRRRVAPATLEAADVAVRFGGVTALDGVSVRVVPGQVVGVIGPNGAGKTTFIDALTGFVRPARGQVRLNGRGIDRWPVHRRARAGIGRSFQSLELFDQSTVRENLLVASEPRTRRSYLTDMVRPATGALTGAAVAAVRDLELEDALDEPVTSLPYGRRRLVAIARAVAAEPSVLLLDEPAAGLSESESAELAGIVRRLADEWGMAILLVEHDVAFVMRVSDRIVVLDFGRRIAGGTPGQVSGDPAVVAAYLGDAES